MVLEMMVKIVEIFYRNFCKFKDFREYMSWRGKFYFIFWESFCSLELIFGKDILVDLFLGMG